MAAVAVDCSVMVTFFCEFFCQMAQNLTALVPVSVFSCATNFIAYGMQVAESWISVYCDSTYSVIFRDINQSL